MSKTVLIINYDEADGSFDHMTPPLPPQSPTYGTRDGFLPSVNELGGGNVNGQPAGRLLTGRPAVFYASDTVPATCRNDIALTCK